MTDSKWKPPDERDDEEWKCLACGEPVEKGLSYHKDCAPDSEGKRRREAREEGRKEPVPESKCRDLAVAKVAKEITDRRYSRGKTQFGKLVMNHVQFDDKRIEIYLQNLALFGAKAKAAQAAGVSPATVYRLQADSPEFQEMSDAAQEIYRDNLKAEIEQWAITGIPVEEFDKDGNPRVTIKRSERMMELLARLHFRQLQPKNETKVGVGIKMPSIKVTIVDEGQNDDGDNTSEG